MIGEGVMCTVLGVEGSWSPAELGAWLKELRESQGLSQEALADKVGKSRQQILSYEKGKNSPSGPALMALLMALDVRFIPPPPEDLVKSQAEELRALRKSVEDLAETVAASVPQGRRRPGNEQGDVRSVTLPV